MRDEDGIRRVNGDVATGRGIGDNTEDLMGTLKDDADVIEQTYEPPLRMVVGTDGLWDGIPSKEYKHALDILDPDQLIKMAKPQSADNITAVSVQFV